MAWIAITILIAVLSLCVFFFTPGSLGLHLSAETERLSQPLHRHDKAMITTDEPADGDPDSPTTPKASAINHVNGSGDLNPVPSFSLDAPSEQGATADAVAPAKSASQLMPPPPAPPPKSPKRFVQDANGAQTSHSIPLSLPQRSASLRAPTGSSASSRTASLVPNPRAPPQRTSSVAAPTSSTLPAPKRPRQKVVLSPGHSPLDWAQLTKTTPAQQLAGVPTLVRVTPSQLKEMNGRKGAPAWSAFGGKVYNIGPYLPFHPGGEGELKRGAGKVADKLFDEVHPWVNVDNMLKNCLVGLLVGDSDRSGASELEEMD